VCLLDTQFQLNTVSDGGAIDAIPSIIVITRSVLFSIKCIRNRLAAGLRPDPLGRLSSPPDPLAVLGVGWDPQEGGEEEMGLETPHTWG